MSKSIKKACVLGSLIASTILLLTGCGEEPYELQDNERDIIVNYAAHIVSKYNTKQPEGYRFVYVPEEELYLTEETEETKEEAEAQDLQNSSEDETKQTDDSEAVAKENETPEEPEAVSLTDALGLKHVQAIYTGAELTDQYDSVIPSEGNQLLVVHVTLQNETSKKRACDIMAMLPMFHATINGEVETTSEFTILPENLATWENDIPAGESVDTIILFQVKKGAVTKVEQLETDVIVDETAQRVILLD